MEPYVCEVARGRDRKVDGQSRNRDKLRAMSLELLPPSTPECFAAYIKTEIERWVVILKNSGAELE